MINGCIRDSVDITAMGIGLKALVTIPVRGSGEGKGELNVEVEFLGAVFRPGGYLYSDEVGILLSANVLF